MVRAASTDDARAVLLVQADGTAEVIGVRVRDEDRVNVARLEVGLLEALLDRVPRVLTREARIDHGDAVAVDECVHVDVAEAGEPNGQLHAQDVLRDLRDLLRRFFLFLSLRSCHRDRL